MRDRAGRAGSRHRDQTPRHIVYIRHAAAVCQHLFGHPSGVVVGIALRAAVRCRDRGEPAVLVIGVDGQAASLRLTIQRFCRIVKRLCGQSLALGNFAPCRVVGVAGDVVDVGALLLIHPDQAAERVIAVFRHGPNGAVAVAVRQRPLTDAAAEAVIGVFRDRADGISVGIQCEIRFDADLLPQLVIDGIGLGFFRAARHDRAVADRRHEQNAAVLHQILQRGVVFIEAEAAIEQPDALFHGIPDRLNDGRELTGAGISVHDRQREDRHAVCQREDPRRIRAVRGVAVCGKAAGVLLIQTAGQRAVAGVHAGIQQTDGNARGLIDQRVGGRDQRGRERGVGIAVSGAGVHTILYLHQNTVDRQYTKK